MDITPQNIEEQVEKLKYSSNKMTQILLDELDKRITKLSTNN